MPESSLRAAAWHLAFSTFSLVLTGVWLILLTTSFVSRAQEPAGSLCERNWEDRGGRGGRQGKGELSHSIVLGRHTCTPYSRKELKATLFMHSALVLSHSLVLS